jgi:hypothetical protein
MTTQPERIYGWLNTQLSIARFAGVFNFNGARYAIAYEEEGQPLVRLDVLKREAKDSKKQKAEQLGLIEEEAKT